MRLTQHTDFAIRVLIYLAVQGEGFAKTEDIAEAYGISAHHLGKVVNRLGKGGYVEVRRGRTGGVRLQQAPEDIVVGDVVLEFEPDFLLAECFDEETNTCPIVPVCKLSGVFEEALEAFHKILMSYTLADLVTRRNAKGYRSRLIPLDY